MKGFPRNKVHSLKPVPHFVSVRETYCGITCYPDSRIDSEASTAGGYIIEFSDKTKEVTCLNCRPGFIRDRS